MTQRRKARRSLPPAEPRPEPAGQRQPPGLWAAFLVFLAALVLGGAALAMWTWNQRTAGPPTLAIEVVNTYPHDATAYTQGLVFDNGMLLEGTGRYGRSTVREVKLETGQVERQVPLEKDFFGEGIAVMDDKIYQLTWKSKTAFVYDRRSLAPIGSFRYTGEGWGLTHDGTHLIMSDGTSRLRFLDPATFRVVKTLDVRMGRRRIDQLNELEYIGGSIYANVWYEDYILKLSPKTGQVEAILDLRGLNPQRAQRDDVLNGIAYDAQANRLFVTGKNWPKLYEIRLVR